MFTCMITSYYNPQYCTLGPDILQQNIVHFFEKLQVTDAEAWSLAQCTSLQAQSSTWLERNKLHLTSFHFWAICHKSHDKPSRSLVNQNPHSSPTPKVASLTRGIVHESIARKQNDMEIKLSKLFISVILPHVLVALTKKVCIPASWQEYLVTVEKGNMKKGALWLSFLQVGIGPLFMCAYMYIISTHRCLVCLDCKQWIIFQMDQSHISMVYGLVSLNVFYVGWHSN